MAPDYLPGSGVQVAALHDQEWLDHARAKGVAVLYIHALNPYGFSHVRRVTNENVDLNRNFQDFSQPLPQNPAYAELHGLLQPPNWPPTPDNAAAIGAYIEHPDVESVSGLVLALLGRPPKVGDVVEYEEARIEVDKATRAGAGALLAAVAR